MKAHVLLFCPTLFWRVQFHRIQDPVTLPPKLHLIADKLWKIRNGNIHVLVLVESKTQRSIPKLHLIVEKLWEFWLGSWNYPSEDKPLDLHIRRCTSPLPTPLITVSLYALLLNKGNARLCPPTPQGVKKTYWLTDQKLTSIFKARP